MLRRCFESALLCSLHRTGPSQQHRQLRNSGMRQPASQQASGSSRGRAVEARHGAAKVPHAEREQVHPETRRQWRAWLKAHHASHAGVWLVTWKKHTGKPAMGYEAAVEEALCFGWVDSTHRRLDDDRNAQWFAPRRRGSMWSGINKQRVARLTAAGSMAPAGLAAVEEAQQSGAWSAMDAAEALVVPEELEAAFSRYPGSLPHWGAFPPSARRSILGWIAQAKRPDTRARRVEQTAALAARGERAK